MMDRRTCMALLGGAVGTACMPAGLFAEEQRLNLRIIPSSGERIPPIGMGSFVTFNVGNDMELREDRRAVLEAFFASGGGLIDSSPMYGSSEEVIGYCLQRLPHKGTRFSATKVWTNGREDGIEQMHASEQLWGVDAFDLMQIHNLVDWQTHMETLQKWKEDGRVRYIGVTTSHGRRHRDLLEILRTQPIDFVQLTYNVLDRDAEEDLLPTAAEHNIAVIANRPFRRKQLIHRVEGSALPAWAKEIDCSNWPQFLLKFIVSHPAVTCAIPATSRVDHMIENMGAAIGRLPDDEMREQMSQVVRNI